MECLVPCSEHVFHWSSDCLYGLHIFSCAFCSDYSRVDWRGGFSSLTFPAMTGMVGICPAVGNFLLCSSFVEFFCNFHLFKHVACLLVGISFKASSLYVIFLFPDVGNGVWKDIVEIFIFHIIGVSRPNKKLQVVVELC